MNLSLFGEKLVEPSGILVLMDDLGKALAGSRETIMLGGGNPAHIPMMEDVFLQQMQQITADRQKFSTMIGDYDSPQGYEEFCRAYADFLRKKYNWPVTEKNIALTNSSQTASFMLFNMFAGKCKNGIQKKILLPLAPEYIGYTNIGLSDNFFKSFRPLIDNYSDNRFKYFIDFDSWQIDDEIGAICLSRPTNPTGNVITDEELAHIDKSAKEREVPLIIDNAYGAPFPSLIYENANITWNENIILCNSLSKIGLPAARTGIIVAREEIIDAIAKMNAIISLAPGHIGPFLLMNLLGNDEISRLSQDIIKPFYEKKMHKAVDEIDKTFAGCDYALHKPEGAFFLWLWLKDMKISSQQLYERLKERGVLIVPGEYFFPGLDEEWDHKNECIRITFAQNDDLVAQGIQIIAAEYKKARK